MFMISVKVEGVADLDATEYKKVSANAYRFITENYNYEDKAREYENIILREYQNYKDKAK